LLEHKRLQAAGRWRVSRPILGHVHHDIALRGCRLYSAATASPVMTILVWS